LRGIGAASADQVLKSVQAGSEGRWRQTVARLAASIPLVGPAMAQAGEKIGEGDYEGVGEGLVLAGAPLAGKVPAMAGRTASAAGRGAQAVGRGVKSVGPLALTVAEHVPGIGGPIRAVRNAGRIMEALDEMLGRGKAPEAAGATVPKPRKPEPVARAEAKAAERKAAKPKPATTHGPRGYFLREPPPVATAADATPLTADLSQLPASWRGRTDQPIARVTKAEVSQMADALLAEGISPAEAMNAVASNPHLPPMVRTELMTALGKIAKRNR
jgi:hypothetical protein